jgi:DNA ligase-1
MIQPSEYEVGGAPTPNVWFNPHVVWEVKTSDLSLSPIYPAAIEYTQQDKGVSLRFPRFIRARDDKGPTDATTAHQVAEMFWAQSSYNNTNRQ